MSGALNHPIAIERPRDSSPATWMLGGLVLAMIAVGLAGALYRMPPPSPLLIVAGGIGLLGVLALAIARYEAAVMLGFLLLGVVKVEPSPPDLIFTMVMLVAALTGRFDVTRVPLSVMLALGAFITMNLLSATEIVDPRAAMLFLSITLYLAAFSVWLAGFVDSTGRARIVVLGYLGAAASSALLGALALFASYPGSAEMIYQETRVQGLFKDPNVFGPFLVPILLILIEETLRPRLLRFNRALKFLLILLLGVGIVLSYSRAAWLNATVGVLIVIAAMFIRRGGATQAFKLIAVIALALGIGVTVISTTGQTDFLEKRAGGHNYDAARFGAQRAGIALAEKSPIGIGPGQFDARIQYDAHSTFVRVLTEQGIIGLLAWLALVAATLAFAVRSVGLGRSTFGIGSGALLGAWCGLLANSFFVDTLHWRHLWLVMALIWVAAMRSSAGDGAGARSPTRI